MTRTRNTKAILEELSPPPMAENGLTCCVC